MSVDQTMHDADHVQLYNVLTKQIEAMDRMTGEFQKLAVRLDQMDDMKQRIRKLESVQIQAEKDTIAYRTRIDTYGKLLWVFGTGAALSLIGHLVRAIPL